MLKNESFDSRMAGKLGYSNVPMNPPPAEKKSNVLQLSLTKGCSHHRCTFCDMYKQDGQDYEVKDLFEFRDHVDDVLRYRKTHRELRDVTRIFLGAGNALSVDTHTLLQASQYSLMALQKCSPSEEVPRRLSVYGNTNDILKKGYREIRELYCGGTCGNCSIGRLGERRGVDVIYWGVESGNTEVLKIAGKGYTSSDAEEAGEILSRAGVRPSVMIMPGLGGVANSDEHVRDTVRLLNRIDPNWVTFIGLKINENTPYAKWMEREEARGSNRRLTPEEIKEQTARMIEGLNITTTIGVHGDDIHKFGHNPATIGVAKIDGRQDARDVAALLRKTSTSVNPNTQEESSVIAEMIRRLKQL